MLHDAPARAVMMGKAMSFVRRHHVSRSLDAQSGTCRKLAAPSALRTRPFQRALFEHTPRKPTPAPARLATLWLRARAAGSAPSAMSTCAASGRLLGTSEGLVH
jgi:hypothetical protein